MSDSVPKKVSSRTGFILSKNREDGSSNSSFWTSFFGPRAKYVFPKDYKIKELRGKSLPRGYQFKGAYNYEAAEIRNGLLKILFIIVILVTAGLTIVYAVFPNYSLRKRTGRNKEPQGVEAFENDDDCSECGHDDEYDDE